MLKATLPKQALLVWKLATTYDLPEMQQQVKEHAIIPGSEQTWSVLLYPRGDGSCRNSHISIYLKCSRWQLTEEVHYSFSLHYPRECDKTIRIESSMAFEHDKPAWGFAEFAPLADLAPNGFLLNDTLHIKCVGMCQVVKSSRVSA
ncbi:hypothetical protein WJX72_007906 [[Myrmecia] bisecta]|uniref:MATH domain-containing protein n=1 Tax=[Myrmecia] bisecta TaxID=41462 RepID=A0AAW1Q7N4_9CHLO